MSRLARALVAIAVAAAALVVGVAWSFASPPVSSPDEDYHLGSIWCPPPAEESGCRMGTVDGKPVVWVPEVMAQRPCYVGRLGDSAACQDELSATELVPSIRFDQGDYPGQYYRIMHAFVGPDLDRSVLTMRVVNVVVAVLLVGAALVLAQPHAGRAATYALFAGLVPTGVFIVASVNPSSWAFVGLTTLWIALNSLAQASGTALRVANGALAVSGAVLASVARGDTGPFVAVIVLALGLLHVRRRPDRGWLAVAAITLAVGAWSYLGSGQAGVAPTVTDVEGRNFGEVLAHNLVEILQVPAGILGVGPWGALGWLEIPMPTSVHVPTISLAGMLLFQGLRRLDRRKALALAVVAGALLALPFYMLMRNLEIAGIQPRYVMSLLPLLFALCLLHPGAVAAYRFTRAQAVLAWVMVTTAHSVALLTTLRRYVTGLDGSYLLGRGGEWWWSSGPSPLAWWLAGSAAYGLAALTLVATAGIERPAASVGRHE
nr:DUF2142 domain-containing protein [Propionibacterium sp.]